MKDWRKIGRFAFVIPYVISPIIMVLMGEDWANALIYTLVPVVEGPYFLVFITAWICSIVCTISLMKENKVKKDESPAEGNSEIRAKRNGSVGNKIILGIILALLIGIGLFGLMMVKSLFDWQF